MPDLLGVRALLSKEGIDLEEGSRETAELRDVF